MQHAIRKGDMVKCVDLGAGEHRLTLDKTYAVNDVENRHNTQYLVILCDDRVGRTLLHSMFKPFKPRR